MNRTRLTSPAFLLTVSVTATLVVAEERALPLRHEMNVIYGEAHGVGLIMDVYTPAGKKNGLAVIDVISGGWHSSRLNLANHERAQVFQVLCGRGYTVFAVRPGSLSRFSVTDMVKHLETAIVWIKERADDYQIDPRRIGLMGASAGGQLASLVAVTNGSSDVSPANNIATVKAVAVLYPLTDFLAFRASRDNPNPFRSRGARVRELAKQADIPNLTDNEILERLALLSPARHVTKDAPPFLLIHGDADDIVPLSQSQALQQALQAKGVSAELVVKEGGGHLWPSIQQEVIVIADWFDRQLAIESKDRARF